MPVIRISNELYKRLEAQARGFDTPASVIERLLDASENKPSSTVEFESTDMDRPELVFVPDEETFKAHLLSQRAAKVVLHYRSGATEERTWEARRFSETSNLRANIWSGYLRGWREEGISKAEFIAGQ